ncbi:Methylcrotonoyl-CoA carboxylase subunit alpha, mitochondrial, partial [Anthophora retusa]
MYPVKQIKIPVLRYSAVYQIPCMRNTHTSKITTNRFDKILIANRGEIACRVIRTAKRLGIRSVAVYSEADRNSMHVEQADEAYCIGPAPSSQSYLRQDKIISIAKKSKCQAIHPGYGFLSENAEFAELCQKENVTFIGPPAKAIKNMGIKSTSKNMMMEAGVPIIAGYHGDDQSNETLLLEARKIGFPLMIKAVRGGGGKGMRIVSKESEFSEALEAARTESEKAFGDSAVLLEQYVSDPRHIEVQVFADEYGHVVHMFERDCSVQRRHQKIIEEAPAPGISTNLRLDLGATAVRAAKAVGYVGAGTVEFIMDRNRNSFYFMEMNTRLQVEHPITEAITGLDLVEWQLLVAAGEELPLKQAQINYQGHAFEARIYAENPRKDFLPGAGKLWYMRIPDITDKTIRVETGVREKDQVSVHYDPMIAKLIVWGRNREEALAILRLKLNDYNIAGLDTNIEFIKDLCSHSDFRRGQVHTGFIEEHRRELLPKLHVPSEIAAQAALATILYEDTNSLRYSLATVDPFSPFATETGIRFNHPLMRTFSFDVCDDNIKVEDREWQFNIPRTKFSHSLAQKSQLEQDPCKASSPIPGLVDKLFVSKGDVVKFGDALFVINAMKMEHIVRASTNGIVENVLCSIGDNVPKNKILIKLISENSKTAN